MRLPTLQGIWSRLKALWADPRPRLNGRLLGDANVTGWTAKIVETVNRMMPGSTGGDLLLPFCRSWAKKGRGEYLCDLTWAYEHGSNRDYRGLALALESELSYSRPEELWADFWKLADIRADLKIFLGAFPGKKSLKHMREFVAELQGFIDQHKHVPRSESYLVVLYFKGSASAVDENLHGWILRKHGRPHELA